MNNNILGHQQIEYNDLSERIHSILEKASTFNERVEGSNEKILTPLDEKLAQEKLEHWCQQVADGDWNSFQKRLDLEGLDLNKAKAALLPMRKSKSNDRPSWVALLEKIMGSYLHFECPSRKELLSYIEQNNTHSNNYHILFLPILSLAEECLKERCRTNMHWLSLEAIQDMLQDLAKTCSFLWHKVFQLELSVFRSLNQQTIAGWVSAATPHSHINETSYASNPLFLQFVEKWYQGNVHCLFEEYSVLARLTAQAFQYWLTNMEEFLDRLVHDSQDLSKHFFNGKDLDKIKRIKTGCSDRHQQGRSVMIVTFCNGFKIVYKPKNLSVDEEYFRWLIWLNEHGAPYHLKGAHSLSRSNYGWQEYIESIPYTTVDESRLYYRRAGAQLCVIYLMGGTDFHNDNMIPNMDQPFIIDLETLLRPALIDTIDLQQDALGEASQLANKKINDSVMRTHFLPFWLSKGVGEAINIGGIMAIFNEKTIESTNLSSNSNGLPKDKKNSFNLEHVDDLCQGFEDMYYFLLKLKDVLILSQGPLKPFSEVQLRIVFRSTSTYALLLESSLHPDVLRDGVDRSIKIDSLSRNNKIVQLHEHRWPIIKKEKEEMEDLDIPYFVLTSSSLHLLHVDANSPLFYRTAYEQMILHFKEMSVDKCKEQLSFIRHTVASIIPSIPSVKVLGSKSEVLEINVPNQRDILSFANHISLLIEEAGIWGKDGTVTWIQPTKETNGFPITPMNFYLYEGTSGLALFWAALYIIKREQKYRDLTLASLLSLRMTVISKPESLVANGVGGMLGTGSLIYTLTKISQMIDEPALLDDAQQIAEKVTDKKIAEDQELDLLGGVAGFILSLLSLYRATGQEKWVHQARKAADHLLQQQKIIDGMTTAWVSKSLGHPLTGMSHGTSGIALALYRLFEITLENSYYDCSSKAIAYESKLYKQYNVWPDLRNSEPEQGLLNAWCHGAAGIGLSRLSMPQISSQIQDIQYALDIVYHQHLLGGSPLNVCCGKAGQLEFLIETSRYADTDEWF